ncbi:MAG: retroviral-like aspartic protease family protein [Caldilineaceae bacterium]
MSRVYSFDYNTDYDPPAPFLPITVDGHDPTRSPITIAAFVDSGADGTMLPVDLLQAVGAEYEASVWLRGSTGKRQRMDSYTVTIHIETETAHAISAVAMPAGSEALIGRDVLNQLVVTLHGIAGVTELQLTP